MHSDTSFELSERGPEKEIKTQTLQQLFMLLACRMRNRDF